MSETDTPEKKRHRGFQNRANIATQDQIVRGKANGKAVSMGSFVKKPVQHTPRLSRLYMGYSAGSKLDPVGFINPDEYDRDNRKAGLRERLKRARDSRVILEQLGYPTCSLADYKAGVRHPGIMSLAAMGLVVETLRFHQIKAIDPQPYKFTNSMIHHYVVIPEGEILVPERTWIVFCPKEAFTVS